LVITPLAAFYCKSLIAKIMNYGKKMTGSIHKIIAILFISYLLGLTFGIIFGIFLGGFPTLFFKEIINSNQEVLVSITLSLILGGLLGFLAMQLANHVFAHSDNPLIGILLGFAVGLIVVFFVEGVIYIPDPETLIKPMYIYPIIYSGIVGSYIGSIIFPIIGVIGVIRDIVANNIEARSNSERFGAFETD